MKKVQERQNFDGKKFIEAKHRSDVFKQYANIAKAVKVCGGYAIFRTMYDYEVWKNEK